MTAVTFSQGGRETLSAYRFHPLFTARELLDDPAIQRRLEELAQGRG